MKKIHLIAIGGAIMHNLAIALKRKGYVVSGSDDAIYDPARTNLENEGLLPEVGWDENHIHAELDLVILGMHARQDNPELIKAKELDLTIMSFPEFIASESKDKKRVVIAGSHGKTTTTSMIMYALQAAGMDFDYLVGSSIDGFDLSVKLSDAPLIIIEGDEYLSSPVDRRSKFLWYEPHISIITGIAYDHINVFPTFESYLQTFRDYIATHKDNSVIYWFKHDAELAPMITSAKCKTIAYDTPEHLNKNGNIDLIYLDRSYPLQIIGEHNLQNLHASMLVCQDLGVSAQDFLHFMSDFSGAGKRMEKVFDKDGQVVFRDFAHSPSKLQATTKAVKDTYDSKELLAVFELHTFSSLNKDFLPLYAHAMDHADKAIVYVDPHVFEHRRMDPLSKDFIKECFGEVEVSMDPNEIQDAVATSFHNGDNILLMSSGTFSKAEFPF